MTENLEEEAEVRICILISKMLPLYYSLFYHCNHPACSLLLIKDIPVDAAISDNSLRQRHICNARTGFPGLDLDMKYVFGIFSSSGDPDLCEKAA